MPSGALTYNVILNAAPKHNVTPSAAKNPSCLRRAHQPNPNGISPTRISPPPESRQSYPRPTRRQSAHPSSRHPLPPHRPPARAAPATRPPHPSRAAKSPVRGRVNAFKLFRYRNIFTTSVVEQDDRIWPIDITQCLWGKAPALLAWFQSTGCVYLVVRAFIATVRSSMRGV